MDTMEALREFLAWCSVVNILILALSTILLIALGGPVSRLHARLFHLEERDVSNAYFRYLAQYKIALLVLNIAPYLALRIMA